MSTKRHGDKIVSDLSKLLLFTIKKAGQITSRELINIISSSSISDERIRLNSRRLRNRGLLSGNASDGYKLTPHGQLLLKDLEFEEIKQTKSWDKKWRVVIYDIPETKRFERDSVRQLLKKLGFYQLQISTWAHPLPCLEQFITIQKTSKLGSCLILMEVDYLSEQAHLLKHFRQIYPKL